MPDQAADAPIIEPSRGSWWRLPLAIAAMLILAAVVLFSGGYVAVQGLSTRKTTDPAAVDDLAVFTRQTGHHLLAQQESSDDHSVTHWIEHK